MSGIDVARVVKKLAERAGLDAAKYAGHSLRAGHATAAAIAGASERSIMNQTGASVGSDGAAVYPGWESLPGEQRGEIGTVKSAKKTVAINVAKPLDTGGIGGQCETPVASKPTW